MPSKKNETISSTAPQNKNETVTINQTSILNKTSISNTTASSAI